MCTNFTKRFYAFAASATKLLLLSPFKSRRKGGEFEARDLIYDLLEF
jgi:hypothetical protein